MHLRNCYHHFDSHSGDSRRDPTTVHTRLHPQHKPTNRSPVNLETKYCARTKGRGIIGPLTPLTSGLLLTGGYSSPQVRPRDRPRPHSFRKLIVRVRFSSPAPDTWWCRAMRPGASPLLPARAPEGHSDAVSIPGPRPEQADLLGPTRTSHSSSGQCRVAAASAIATSSKSGSTSSGAMSSESGSKASE